MGNLITTETHTRKHRVVLEQAELHEIIAQHVSPVRVNRKGVTFKVTIEKRDTSTGFYDRATVEVTEDLLPQAAEVPEQDASQ
jgi:hypothetical protein